MTTSASVPNEASDTTPYEAQGASQSAVEGTADTVATKPVNELTEALSEVIRGVNAGHRDSVEISSENTRQQDEIDLAFGHYAAARWDS